LAQNKYTAIKSIKYLLQQYAETQFVDASHGHIVGYDYQVSSQMWYLKITKGESSPYDY
jgi:hypothetical protein